MIAQQWRTPANAVTLLRLALTPAVLILIVRGRHREAAAWFVAAAFTDLVDGWLARAQQATTPVGQYLDPVADKILLSGVFVALAIQGSAPRWFVALVLGRDFAILAASAIALRWTGYHDYAPSVWGKISTALQILAAVTIMTANAEGSGAFHRAVRWTVLAAAAGTLWSAIHYAWRGAQFFVGKPVLR